MAEEVGLVVVLELFCNCSAIVLPLLFISFALQAVDAAVKLHELRGGPCKSRELAIVGTE